MIIRIVALMLFITSVMYVDNALALDRNGKYAIKGVGNASCDQYVKITETDDPQKFLFAGWINGYMTAHNQHLKDTFDIVSWENIETLGNYLRSHCKKNPNLSFFQATTQMLSELHEKRIVEFISATNMASGNQSQKSYIQVVQRVQKKLIELKLFKGADDGKMSAELVASLNVYRKAQGMLESDSLDQQVLHALLR